MSQRLEYTTLAQAFTARFPLFVYVATQTIYRTIANLLLVALVNMLFKIMATQLQLPFFVNPGSLMIVAIVLGVIYG
jgi:adenylate cyclase